MTVADKNDDYVLLIPTRNRPAFLQCALEYYSRCGFQRTIVIADSSDAESLEKNEDLVSKYTDKLLLKHHVFPFDIYCVQKLILAIEALEGVPFVALAADDDIWVISALEECFACIKKDDDLASVGGLLAKPNLGDIIASKRRPHVRLTKPDTCLSDNPIERGLFYAKVRRQRIYCMHRRECLVDALRLVAPLEELITVSFSEFCFYLSLMISGKFLCIDRVSYIQMLHKDAWGQKEKMRRDVADQKIYQMKEYLFCKNKAAALIENLMIKNGAFPKEVKGGAEIMLALLFEHDREDGGQARIKSVFKSICRAGIERLKIIVDALTGHFHMSGLNWWHNRKHGAKNSPLIKALLEIRDIYNVMRIN